MLHSGTTLDFKLLIPDLPILYLLPLPPHHRPLLLAVLLPPLPLTLSGFSNGMLEIFEPGALNYFIFSLPILLTLSVSSNPILTHLPLSGILDSLLCVLIAPTPGLAFSFLMPRTLATISFSSLVLHWVRIVKLPTQHVEEATLGYPPMAVRLVGGGATSRCWGYFHNWFEMGYHFSPSLIQSG